MEKPGGNRALMKQLLGERMLAQSNITPVHAGEDQSSTARFAPVQGYSINHVETDAQTLVELVIDNDWLRAGDVVYVITINRIVLTDSDLNAAARAVIGGEQ
jgi:hypothetical protein